ncbi:MAG TPA: DUF4190 domain-containing protein [Nocardioidaceae bacterium]|jgi:hypothetical protein|nr:DUF4190 domain-containing protein [Nocardioidaceae bacterium]
MSYPPPPPPPPGAGGYGYVQQQTNKKAIWALVLGILSLVCCGLFAGIPAIILGNMARSEIDASGGLQSGRGMAVAGFVLGIIGVVWTIVALILEISTGAFTGTFGG